MQQELTKTAIAEAVANSTEAGNRAPNVLLLGMPGTGKTHAIRTLLEAGLEVFIVFTEPGMEILSDTDPEKCHWHYVPPSSGGFDEMLKSFQDANKFAWDALIKMPDTKKKSYDSAVELIRTFADFPCDRTGKTYGDVTEWGFDRAIVLDSLSGVNKMTMQLITGQAWGVSQPQWGAAMKAELGLIDKLCIDTKCMFVLTAHLERLVDEVNGGMLIQANALGKKNAPEIPKNFSDVILTKREKGEFKWSTEHPGADLKARNVPWARDIVPSFVPLLKTWRDRMNKAGQ